MERGTENYEETCCWVNKRGVAAFICSEDALSARGVMTTTAPSKETILVVDDEASIRRILETRLSMIGYNVVTACDGTEALELFHNCVCLLYTSPSPRDYAASRMPSSA